jgi:hypothetical protein
MAIAISTSGYTQVTVTATVGTTGPTSYTTLKDAFDAVNAGTHKGVIGISISGNTTETLSAVLNASGTGASLYTMVNIQTTSALSSVTGNIAGPLVDLNGADHVVIDGLNNGVNSLTISNLNIGQIAGTCTIRFYNDATADTIRNVNLLGATTGATNATVFFSTAAVTGNNDNVITGCSIADAAGNFPANAIYAEGTVGFENNNNKITNNSISNYFSPTIVSVGILVGINNTGWTISDNKLFQTATRTFTVANTHRGIQINNTGNNYLISNNTIGYSSALATGVYTLAGTIATRFIAIDLAVGTTVATSVQGNTISSFSLATSSSASTTNGIWCAINLTAGNANIGTVTGNIIGSTSGTGSIVANPSVAGSAIIPINSSSTGTVVISNNTIGGIDLLATGVLSGNIQCIQTTGSAGTITLRNNIIGNSLSNNIRVGVLNTTTGNGLVRGVLNSNSGSISINGNTIRNLTHNSNNALALFRAIECQQGTANISNNNISNISANGASTSASTPEGAGILATTALPGLTIDSNIISNLNATNSVVATGPVILGIYLGSTVTGVSVTRNKVYGFTNAGTSTSTTAPSIIAGIYFRDAGAGNPNILVANNMISFGNAQTTNTAIIGIWSAAASANGLTSKIYYNTVNIEGTSSTQPSFCFYRGDFSATAPSTPIVDIKNNLFTNSRSGGTSKNYAIANSYPATTSSNGGWASNASNYNILNAAATTIGYWSGDADFTTWQNNSQGDGNGYANVTINYVNNVSDLHLIPATSAAADGKATPVSVTIDIDNTNRNALNPDIGADEFSASLAVGVQYITGKKQSSGNLIEWKISCTSASVTFDIQQSNNTRTFTSIGNFSATQLRCSQAFDFLDNQPLSGTNYYRLKMTEPDGNVSYSIIVAVVGKNKDFELVALMPTLVNSSTVLNLSSSLNTKIDIAITDNSGKLVYRQSALINNGSNTMTLNLSELAAGTYLLNASTAEGKNSSIRFVKQ